MNAQPVPVQPVPAQPALRQFFGDRDRDFRLTPELVAELERITGTGIGGFTRRVMATEFRLADLHATIRLALIGGGTDPQEAQALIAAYVAPRPVLDAFALAVAVLDHLMTGEVQSIANSASGSAAERAGEA
ncbi:gene transfer agent family protein [Frigidibacter oleivorans]|uniref:gene transfer agent family protein n=1 Tax=Frigidibacter oleivorans TaxID=2487129 RepID=UPI000F8C3574|nr:gene transfer agent family protein [Frigidibacter oleivorans]